MKKALYLFSALLMIAAVSCQKPENGPDTGAAAGPELVSSTPEDGAVGISSGTLTMTLTFNMSVMCPTAQRGRITVDSGAQIDGIDAYASDVTVKLSSLERGKTYTVSFPSGTITGYKDNPVSDISISFTTKDASGPSDIVPDAELCNPDASPQARNVYSFLVEQCGVKTLSGVQSSDSNTNDFVDLVYKSTGRHPALAGYDFIFLQYSPTPAGWSWVKDYSDISAAKEQWDANGLVSYMWHWNVPNSKSDWENGANNYNFDGYAFYCDKTSFDINEALKPGTWQNDFIMKDIEEAAGYLKLLRDAGIPVIWRPLHEAAGNYTKYGSNGAWFWWGRGGAEPCKQLWRLLYDQFTNVHGLDNLIWVWTVDVTEGCENEYLDWYPGNEYVDIVGVDIYEDNTGAKDRQYNALVELTGGRKLVTVSECGNIPDPSACMEAGNKWSWFMVWPSSDQSGNLSITPVSYPLNTAALWKSVMSGPYTLAREDMPSLK
ncbi:MAG: Ig-like domain-containing protein [Clostridium sp.]|nr:Ig-like domain-containing protein [Bacteroides sp.]MCM1197779.1 Ig-like domain-containing protein [Clostridium sp.]